MRHQRPRKDQPWEHWRRRRSPTAMFPQCVTDVLAKQGAQKHSAGHITSGLCHFVVYQPSYPQTSQLQSHRNQNPSRQKLRDVARTRTLPSQPELVTARSANSCSHRDTDIRTSIRQGANLQTKACTKRATPRHHLGDSRPSSPRSSCLL